MMENWKEKAQAFFAGKQPEKPQQAEAPAANKTVRYSNEELVHKVIDACAKALCEKKTEGREGFVINGTQNVGVITLMLSYGSTEEWRVFVGAMRRGTDWQASHSMWKGSKEEMLAKLLSQEGQQEIYESVMELSAKVDEHWD